MTHPNSLTIGAFLLWGVVILLPTTANAQSYAQQVWEQLQAHYRVVADLGDYRLQNYVMGTLDEDATDTWTFPFDNEDNYVITAACDLDCADIDVTIKTESGRVVKEDTSTDDQPFVEFTPRFSERYQIEVKMYTCSNNPCYFGFGIFRQ